MKRARAHEYGCEHASECVSSKQQQNLLLRLATRALQTPVRLCFVFFSAWGARWGGVRDPSQCASVPGSGKGRVL